MPATHRTDPIYTRTIAKPGGGMRVMARLSARDRRVWDRLGAQVAPLLERRMDVRVLANRARRSGRAWAVEPVGPALERAIRARRRFGARRAVTATDVRAFYPSVRPEVLYVGLLRAHAGDPAARLAAGMLEGWEETGHRGLPIGPDGSAILANAVLLPVDESLADVPFLRWVDDYLLPARFPIERLDEALDAVGLERSIEKTGPLRPGDAWPSRSGTGYAT